MNCRLCFTCTCSYIGKNIRIVQAVWQPDIVLLFIPGAALQPTRAETLSPESRKSKQRWHSEWLFGLICKEHLLFQAGGCPQAASGRSGRDWGQQRPRCCCGRALQAPTTAPRRGSVTAGKELLHSSRCQTAGYSKTTLTSAPHLRVLQFIV